MNTVGRKVKLLRLQTSTHITGLGNIGPVVDAKSTKLANAITMQRTSTGVLLSGAGFNDSEIPEANCQVIEYFNESK
jgi:hypothetical protein